MKYATVLSLVMLLAAPIVTAAQARHCHVGTSKVVVASSALVAFPSVQTFVGAPYRVEALVEQQKLADPDYQEFVQFKQFKSQFQAFMQSKDGVQAQVQIEQSPVQQHCASCHATGKPQSTKFNSDEPPTLESLKKILGRVTADADSGQMPPPDKHPISADQRGELLQFLSK